MLTQSISKNSFILTAFALVTAALLSLTHESTADKIAQAERKAAQKALFEIIPAHTHDNDLLSDTWLIPPELQAPLGLTSQEPIFIAKHNGQPFAMIIPTTAHDGYSGAIKLIVGVYADGSIAGVRTLSHKETPGLGDKVDANKSDWIFSFNHKSLQSPSHENWKVKKDGGAFDQFTGATITPRAVVKQVRNALLFFNEHKESIFNPNTRETPDE